MIYIYDIYIYMCDMYTYTWWNNQWIVDESDWDQVFHALSTLWWTSHLTETRESRTWTRSTNRRSQLKMVIAAGKNLCWFRRPAQHCRNNTRLCQKLIKSCSAQSSFHVIFSTKVPFANIGLPLQPRFRTVRTIKRSEDEIIAWVAAQDDGTNAGFVFGVMA